MANNTFDKAIEAVPKFVAYFEIITSLFVYIEKGYKSVISSSSIYSPFGNHT